VSWGPLLYGAAVSWGLAANRDLDVAEILNQVAFDDADGTLGGVLVRIGRVDRLLDAPSLNSNPLFRVLQWVGKLDRFPTPEALAAARAELTGALDDLDVADPACADGAELVVQLRQAVRLAIFAADLLDDGLLLREPSADDRANARTLLRRFDALMAEQRTSWLMAARPGGLDTSIDGFTPLRRALAVRAGG
jgi:hexosaminidase